MVSGNTISYISRMPALSFIMGSIDMKNKPMTGIQKAISSFGEKEIVDLIKKVKSNPHVVGLRCTYGGSDGINEQPDGYVLYIPDLSEVYSDNKRPIDMDAIRNFFSYKAYEAPGAFNPNGPTIYKLELLSMANHVDDKYHWGELDPLIDDLDSLIDFMFSLVDRYHRGWYDDGGAFGSVYLNLLDMEVNLDHVEPRPEESYTSFSIEDGLSEDWLHILACDMVESSANSIEKEEI